MFCFC